MTSMKQPNEQNSLDLEQPLEECGGNKQICELLTISLSWNGAVTAQPIKIR